VKDPAARLELWRHNYAMRMLRWLLDRDRVLQRDFMREYHRIGAKGTNFDDNFGRYTTTTRTGASTQRVILQTTLAPRRYELEWVGPELATWLAALSTEELQEGFTALERAMLDTGDAHCGDWAKRLRDEMFRRSLRS
jgi:hypothetical protein